MKKFLLIFSVLTVLLLAACSGKEEVTSSSEEKKAIKVGFGVGTYEEAFRESIKPILEEKGYEIEIEVFSQNTQVNPAMIEDAIDASIFQSTAYMKDMNKELGGKMTGIAYVPSAPQGLYSVNHKSLDEVKDGMTVGLPNDPVNQERAVHILEDLGWIKIEGEARASDFNINQVVAAEYELDFKILDPAQILVSLQDLDFGVVNGNYIANAEAYTFLDALQLENTPLEHRIIVSINEEDKDTQWAKDLVAAYESTTFEDYILAQDKYQGFVLPDAWENN